MGSVHIAGVCMCRACAGVVCFRDKIAHMVCARVCARVCDRSAKSDVGVRVCEAVCVRACLCACLSARCCARALAWLDKDADPRVLSACRDDRNINDEHGPDA